MKYFHRTHLSPDAVLREAMAFFGQRLAPVLEEPRRRRFAGALGEVTVAAAPEGGHCTRVEVGTNQVGESEADKLVKRFLTLLHAAADPSHRPLGAY